MHNLHSSKSINNIRLKQYTFGQKQVLGAILAVIIIIVIVWIWKNIEINSLKKERQRSEEALIQRTKQHMEATNRRFLKLVAKPYVWAVRKELMQGNLEQLNLYGNDIVKEKNFLSVMLTDSKGMILTSTDKKYEGKFLSSVWQNFNVRADSTIVHKASDRSLVLTSPVMSFNSKIGTLIINYSLENFR